MKKQIEVEYRALLTEAEYHRLSDFLAQNGEDLGEDHKDLYYFLFPDRVLKVVNNLSRQTAKISLKIGRFEQGHAAEELELEIKPAEVEQAINMMTKLGFKHYEHAHTDRHNFLYQGVEFALKLSSEDEWGYHLEMEVLVDNPEAQLVAEEKIKSLAEELAIKLMTREDLLALEAQITKSKNLKIN